jgi:hypothetical protein
VTDGRSVEERGRIGEAARATAPLSAIASWRPAGDRPDPVALLEEQAATRLPDLVPVRYGRMSASPFAFYRGAASPMAADLATIPVSGLRTQLCGDAHLGNFGMFASPERDLEFDVTDFDETMVGPWEWDVLRLAGSLVVASRVRGFDAHKAQRAVEAMTPDDLTTWGELAAWALARGHANAGDPAAIAGYLGTGDAFAHAVAEFASVYADQTERDFESFLAAVKTRRIAAQAGV